MNTQDYLIVGGGMQREHLQALAHKLALAVNEKVVQILDAVENQKKKINVLIIDDEPSRELIPRKLLHIEPLACDVMTGQERRRLRRKNKK
jgi:hypothetical protein